MTTHEEPKYRATFIPPWYTLLVVSVTILIMLSINVFVSNYQANEEGRKLCALMTTLDTAYQAAPPSTPTGRQVAADVHHLRDTLGCNNV